MTSQVYLVGSDVPVWVAEAPDVLTGRIEATEPGALLRVTAIVCHDEDEDIDPYYEEYGAYLRADEVAYVAPLGPRARKHLAEARAG